MSGFTSRFWHWLFNRSPRNAATPKVQPIPPMTVPSPGTQDGSCPIETNIRTESIVGLLSKLGVVESASRGPDGQLITAEDKFALILGCGHLVDQVQAVDREGEHIRGIAGQCEYCVRKNQELLSKGKISIFDAERLSLVCSDCGKTTTSGLLCCPKHYREVVNPDGTKSYLDPGQSQQIERQQAIQMPLRFIAGLFGEEGRQPSQSKQEPEDNA